MINNTVAQYNYTKCVGVVGNDVKSSNNDEELRNELIDILNTSKNLDGSINLESLPLAKLEELAKQVNPKFVDDLDSKTRNFVNNLLHSDPSTYKDKADKFMVEEVNEATGETFSSPEEIESALKSGVSIMIIMLAVIGKVTAVITETMGLTLATQEETAKAAGVLNAYNQALASIANLPAPTTPAGIAWNTFADFLSYAESGEKYPPPAPQSYIDAANAFKNQLSQDGITLPAVPAPATTQDQTAVNTCITQMVAYLTSQAQECTRDNSKITISFGESADGYASISASSLTGIASKLSQYSTQATGGTTQLINNQLNLENGNNSSLFSLLTSIQQSFVQALLKSAG